MAGAQRMFLPPPVPEVAPFPFAQVDEEGVVRVSWERSAQTIGLDAELHRGSQPLFALTEKTLLIRTSLSEFVDRNAPQGSQYYALVLYSKEQRSRPTYTGATVPAPKPPAPPTGLKVLPISSSVRLAWQAPRGTLLGYHVYRGKAGSKDLQKITTEPIRQASFADASVEPEVRYAYAVGAVSHRGLESDLTGPVEASAKVIREPVFVAKFDGPTTATLLGGETLPGMLHPGAAVSGGVLDTRKGGHATFPHHTAFDLGQPMSVECWVRFEKQTPMPIVVSCGVWNQSGWFLQWLGGQWRWHVGGVDCDGGKPVADRWMHLVAVYDGRGLALYQDGVKVAERTASVSAAVWPGELHVGQYSGGLAPSYQTQGRIAGLKVYHRPLEAKEITAAAKAKPE
jgi:hypothetical protein